MGEILNKEHLYQINFLEKIIAKLPGLVYCKNTDGVYLSCNEAQAKIIGFESPINIIGKTDFDFLNKEEATKLTNRDKLIMSGKLIIDAAHPIEETIILPNGKTRLFESIKIPFYDNQKILGLIGVSRDITELKETQTALIPIFRSKFAIIFN